MSLNLENQKCVVCGAYLFPEDEVVYCPTCGAPHHKDCYKSLGKCGMEQFHGTDNQYKKPEVTETTEENKPENKDICLRCGKKTVENSKFCPYCGAPNLNADFKSIPFGNFTVIDGKAPIEKDVTAEDVAKVVMLNPLRYIEKFKKLKNGRNISFNWAAFLVPHGWFAFRKMYKASFMITAFKVIANILQIPLFFQLSDALGSNSLNPSEILKYLTENPTESFLLPGILLFVSGLLTIIIHVASALFADKTYKAHVVERVRKIKADSDPESALRKFGGISTIGFVIALLAVEFLPSFISTFLR